MIDSKIYLNTEQIINIQNNYDQIVTWKKSHNYIDSTNIICYDYCKICDGVMELNLDNVIINQNCLNCIDEHHFIYDRKIAIMIQS